MSPACIKGAVHLLAQCRDVPARLNNSLPPIIVLVQMVAEVLEDGSELAGLVSSHIPGALIICGNAVVGSLSPSWCHWS